MSQYLGFLQYVLLQFDVKIIIEAAVVADKSYTKFNVKILLQSNLDKPTCFIRENAMKF